MPSRSVNLSHGEKVLFPGTGGTKEDLFRYYTRVAPALLPHLSGRPVTLVRYPDGVGEAGFYEKNAPRFTPDWVQVAEVPRKEGGGNVRYVVVDDVATLQWCANLAAIELHPFLHRAADQDHPTHLVFDLDPGQGCTVLECAEVALLAREVLTGLGLECWPKVSGSKGIQVYVPLNSRTGYEAAGAFARALAELLARQHPDRVIAQMARAKRKGKVFIDWSQNAPAKTTVAPYSLRGKRDEPFVSAPVDWKELTSARKAESLFFSPEAVLRRVARRGDLFLPVLELKQRLPAAFLAARAAPAPLAAYRRKRDFSVTREPSGSRRRAPPAEGLRFVIQKHAATHLHYDFRLEMDGVLRSWAVPKGLPHEPGVRRSAFAVEDHPLDYLQFEGIIPQGQYGGGTVMVWDIGTYRITHGSFRQGKFRVELFGRKLRGEWNLFRIRSDDGKDVWLVVRAGEPLKPLTPRQEDRSALTARSMSRIAAEATAVWK